ncbi:MAG TPA: helix-turn-helix transcriptional regulator [Solirubrobacteraceae bacterium]|nr:helix-turn-helix transcriptional regulator [Solirubrobacteraceae bacterium]
MESALRQLGENVKRLRDEAGLAQEELAEMADLDRTMISLVENGKKLVRIDTLVKLSRALGIPLSVLVKDVT